MEDIRGDGDDLLSVVVKEEYGVQEAEEEVLFVKQEIRMVEIPLDTSLDCHVCGETHKNVQCLLRHLASRHGGLVTEISDSLSTPTPHCSNKKDQADVVKKSHNLEITSRSKMSIKAPVPGYKKIECDKCGVKYTYKRCFIRHYREVHLGIVKFKCEQCKKMFRRNSQLKRHLKSHSNMWYSCEICKKVLKGAMGLKNHLKTHAGKKIECDKCEVKFTRQDSFRRHYRQFHLGMKNFKCEQCKKVFKQHSDLKIHLKTHSNKSLSVTSPKEHQKDQVEKFPDMKIPSGSEISVKTPLPRCKTIECDKCGLKSTHRGGFIRHYREVHLGIKNFKCEQCEKAFSRRFVLKRHLEGHSSNTLSVTSIKEHQKDQVEKFPDMEILPRSEISIKAPRPGTKKLECDKCGAKLAHESSFRRHFRAFHLGKKNFKCEQCKKAFRQHYHLKMHLKSHSNMWYSCEICKRALKGAMGLKKHLKTHAGKKIECYKCEVKFARQDSFRKHYRQFHLGMKNFKCEQCKKVFKQHSDLKIHLKTHSNKSLSVKSPKEHQEDQVEKCPDMEILPRSEISIKTPRPGTKILECDKCGVKFTYQRCFIRHYREVHLGIVKFKCEQCKKMFRRNSQLKRHLKSHSNMWYSCEICKKALKGAMGLKNHLKNHAGKKIECDKCEVKFTRQYSFRRHYRQFHLGMKNFKCEQCKKVFKQHSDLKIHLKTHSNKSLSVKSPKEYQEDQVENFPAIKIPPGSEISIKTPIRRRKTFECDKCGLKSTHHGGFIRHYREVHLGIRNFKCEQCEKAFSRRFDLKRHLEGHSSNTLSVTSIKEHQKDQVEKFPDMEILPRSEISIKKPLPGTKKLECDKCGAKLAHESSFIRHYREFHLGKKNFKCKQCKKAFRQHYRLKIHLKSHSNMWYSCEVCKKALKGAMGLKKHLKTHAGNKIECDKCEVKFAHKDSFRLHYRQFHLGIGKFKCEQCKKVFRRHCDLKTHLKTHSNKSLSVTSPKEHQKDQMEKFPDIKISSASEISIKTPLSRCKKFECDKCGTKLTYKRGFIRHFKEVHLGMKRFKCKQCKKIFKRNIDLQSHLKCHSNKPLSVTSSKNNQIDQVETSPNLKITSESSISNSKILLQGSKKFECKECGLKVMHRQNITRHYNEVHLGIKNFKCEQCNKVFSRYYDLKIHQKTHSKKSLSVTSPNDRQKDQVEKFPDIKIPPGSEISIKTQLAGSKKFECDKCGVKFTRKDSFRRHYREVHLRIRNFRCEQCKKVFSQHSYLKIHLESHSNKLPSVTSPKEHQKDQVEESTDWKIQLSSKTGLIEAPLLGSKEFKCEICGAKLTYERGFVHHYWEAHLGMKNFKCRQCEKVFSRHFDLKRHLESHSSNILSVTSSIEHQKDQVDKFPDLKIQPLDLR